MDQHESLDVPLSPTDPMRLRVRSWARVAAALGASTLLPTQAVPAA